MSGGDRVPDLLRAAANGERARGNGGKPWGLRLRCVKKKRRRQHLKQGENHANMGGPFMEATTENRGTASRCLTECLLDPRSIKRIHLLKMPRQSGESFEESL